MYKAEESRQPTDLHWAHFTASSHNVRFLHQTIVTYSLFALTASTLRIKLLDVHWTLMYFHPSRLCVAPRSCQDSFVVFGAVNDLVIQTVQWCDVTSHPALTSHLSVEIWKIHPHRYLLRHYWLTDIHVNVEINVLLNPEINCFDVYLTYITFVKFKKHQIMVAIIDGKSFNQIRSHR